MDVYGLDQGVNHADRPIPRRSFPPKSWPSREQLEYVIRAITAFLMLLALPWLIKKLITDPGGLFAGAGRQHVSVPT